MHRGNHLFFDHRRVLVLLARCLRIVNFQELRKDEFAQSIFQALGRSFLDGATPAQTQAHRSNGRCQRRRLRHLLCPPTICSTPMQRTRFRDRVYCLRTADKAPDVLVGGLLFLLVLQEN
jgi:hypothetical protein